MQAVSTDYGVRAAYLRGDSWESLTSFRPARDDLLPRTLSSDSLWRKNHLLDELIERLERSLVFH